MKIQIIDVLSDDMEDGSNVAIRNIVSTIYGKTQCNKSIVCSVAGYKPYFYMKIPNKWTKSTVNKFFRDI